MNPLVKKKVKEAKEKEEDNRMITKPYPAWIDSVPYTLSARLKNVRRNGRPAPASSAFPGKMWAGSAEWGTVP